MTIDYLLYRVAAVSSRAKSSSKQEKATSDDLDEQAVWRRKNIKCLRRPDLVLWHFCIVVWESAVQFVLTALATPWVTFGVLPFLALVFFGLSFDGPHSSALSELVEVTKFFVWWVGLGVLSSVGLGTGLHTGVMFMFPFITMVTLAAVRCGTVEFPARELMWDNFGAIYSIQCPEGSSDNAAAATFSTIFFKVVWATALWGAGTAMGEIPPYAISRAARLAGEENEVPDELKGDGSGGLVDRMTDWMIDFLKRHGFWGVLVFSAWPNMAFDLCGMCCGHFLMPFWTFFGATLIGKGAIKAPMQAVVLVAMFSTNFFDRVLDKAEAVGLEGGILGAIVVVGALATWRAYKSKGALRLPLSAALAGLVSYEVYARKLAAFIFVLVEPFYTLDARAKLEGMRSKLASSEEQEAKEDGLGGKIWGYMMIAFIASFAVSCMEQFAQQRAARLAKGKAE
jgi:membrane protein YqaA with SNARE-associated domain